MHYFSAWGLDSLVLAFVFGYCTFQLASRLFSPIATDSWGVLFLLGIGCLACLVMTLFALAGHPLYRAIRSKKRCN